ncbi:glycosyltransferase family 2 protein [Paenibacillus abyssi]|uniref:Glycosyltransferase 2-like domain-containing protein n=1 Tax=Paenibacillus abyssi TaxID=1340531 RepID=A0A917CV35_9BACL|nr:glycosyltransferase family 2 protein [Paenibacillus abyssi]GGF98691.1 hypothetical protein GCM10010916_14920 [Paenibacillus abyssi]
MMNKAVKRADGYNDGYNKGFNKGYHDGYSRGKLEGAAGYSIPFDGTSIIIPTYNQLLYLKECIESIVRYTPEPYELIIIDNASVDGTADYLKAAGGLRFRINKENLGFAGAVNQGLMMARGSTLMILNNDSVVTPHWLSNLLACLHSNPRFGIVGPVTNYISGDQLIGISYTNMTEMQQFANSYNQSNPERWTIIGRLTGFCMLLKRDVFNRLGYFDEGFEIGNCEDDDYGLRARLLGLQLVIAKDTFIHHYGSVSMKSLNDRFNQVYEKNLSFYANKWVDPNGLLSLDWLPKMNGLTLRTVDSYPTCVTVQGAGSTMYWVENGKRSPINGSGGLLAVRVSQIDLRNWELGAGISAEEVKRRIQALRTPSQSNDMAEGRLVKAESGAVYQRKGKKLHRFMNHQALASWQLDLYAQQIIDQHELNIDEEGPPIIAPPVIKADNL